jgi:hypothetical protein
MILPDEVQELKIHKVKTENVSHFILLLVEVWNINVSCVEVVFISG